MNAYEYYIEEISKLPKNHYRSMKLQKTVNEHISGLRMTAKKMRGTGIARFCNQQSNYFERKLKLALEKKDE